MRKAVVLALLALPASAAAQELPPPLYESPAHVRVTARIVTVDRAALTRAGLAYVVLGNDRVRVHSTGRGGTGVAVGTHGVSAFLHVARERRWLRSESTQQVLALSGGEAVVSSSDLEVGRYAARTRGPTLAVSPTVLPDGRVHLRVAAGVEDEVSYGWGYRVDASPAAVATELVVRPGEEVLLASSSAVQSGRASGLLRWGGVERGRDVLVAVSVTVR